MSEVDRIANDHVDSLAKAAAGRHASSADERRRIVNTSRLVEDIARWIGQITVLANIFPFVQEDGTKVVLRDSDAKKRRPKQVCDAGEASSSSASAVIASGTEDGILAL